MEGGGGGHGRSAPASRAVGTARLPVSGAAAACHAGRACSAAAGAAPQPVAPGPFPAACRGSPSWRPPKRRERPARGWAPAPGGRRPRRTLHGQEGARPPRPPTAQRGLARAGTAWWGSVWMGPARLGVAWPRLGDGQCHMPTVRHGSAWLSTARHGSGGAEGLDVAARSAGRAAATGRTARSGVTQQHQTTGRALRIAAHGVAGQVAAPEPPLLPVACLRVGRAVGSIVPQAPSPACAGSVGTRGSPAQHHEDPGCRGRVYGCGQALPAAAWERPGSRRQGLAGRGAAPGWGKEGGRGPGPHRERGQEPAARVLILICGGRKRGPRSQPDRAPRGGPRPSGALFPAVARPPVPAAGEARRSQDEGAGSRWLRRAMPCRGAGGPEGGGWAGAGSAALGRRSKAPR